MGKHKYTINIIHKYYHLCNIIICVIISFFIFIIPFGYTIYQKESPDYISVVYDFLKNKGYNDIGDYNIFRSKLQDENNRRLLYDALKKKENSDIGNYNTFNDKLKKSSIYYNRKWVYNTLKSQTGYVDNYDDFNKAIDKDKNTRKKVYDVLTHIGIDMGSYDDFNNAVGHVPLSINKSGNDVNKSASPVTFEFYSKNPLTVYNNIYYYGHIALIIISIIFIINISHNIFYKTRKALLLTSNILYMILSLWIIYAINSVIEKINNYTFFINYYYVIILSIIIAIAFILSWIKSTEEMPVRVNGTINNR